MRRHAAIAALALLMAAVPAAAHETEPGATSPDSDITRLGCKIERFVWHEAGGYCEGSNSPGRPAFGTLPPLV